MVKSAWLKGSTESFWAHYLLNDLTIVLCWYCLDLPKLTWCSYFLLQQLPREASFSCCYYSPGCHRAGGFWLWWSHSDVYLLYPAPGVSLVRIYLTFRGCKRHTCPWGLFQLRGNKGKAPWRLYFSTGWSIFLAKLGSLRVGSCPSTHLFILCSYKTGAVCRCIFLSFENPDSSLTFLRQNGGSL